VQRAVANEDAADEHRRPPSAVSRAQPLELARRALDQRRLEHQVLGRIADQCSSG
jgi:hypothetical protein